MSIDLEQIRNEIKLHFLNYVGKLSLYEVYTAN